MDRGNVSTIRWMIRRWLQQQLLACQPVLVIYGVFPVSNYTKLLTLY
jgi:hypothetical protein